MQNERTSERAKLPEICVIGAGPSGLAAVKNLKEQGLYQVTVFEKNSQIGGNWVYSDATEHSSVYQSTHLISSKKWSQFDDFPMPWEYPDYPSHELVLKYFQDYAAHFELLPYIKFNTKVLHARHLPNQQWEIDYEDASGRHTRIFDYLIVANGHHWNPYTPQYSGTFDGQMIHSHSYKNADPFKGQRVLVIGGGNSGCDIAVDLSRVARETCISLRRGYHIFPKFILGKPTDEVVSMVRWMPSKMRQSVIKWFIRGWQGRYPKYKLQKPDCGPLELHPTVNSELLYHIRHGNIHPLQGIDRFMGNKVYFSDGTIKEFDTVIWATGYKISLPFFDPKLFDFSQATEFPLYRKFMHPDFESLYFIGFCQPQGCIWPLSDYQSRVVSRLIKGELKRPKHLHAKIAQELQRPHHRFLPHMRHALEVDYHKYRKELLGLLKSLA